LRLYEPESPATYACLSYCWGADLEGVLKTTKENLLQQLEGIDIASLPKTIADAVTVCRGLNIANLWVDSLCIIQDDLDDWLSQSSQMLDIYAKSYVTIYAKEASSCKLGFLGPQRYGDRRWQRPIKTPVPPELALPGDEFYIRDNTCYSERPTSPPDTHGNPSPNRTINLGDDEFIVQSNDESHSEEPTFPLDTRGWCLQENLLPNRKLFYDGNEMSWECCTRRICECGHWTKMDLDPWNSETLLSFKDMLGLAKISSSNRHTRQGKTYPLEHWEEIVMAYSRRNLTMFEDKLTAISGLAKLFAQATEAVGEKDPYHGGLWASRFITGLSWQTSGAKRPVEYSAPTWSWASVDGPITRFKDGPMCYPDRVKYRRKHVRIDEVVCEPVLPSDKLGRIKGGYAIVTGPVVEVELVTLGEGWDSSRAGWLVGFPDLPFSYEGNISMVRSRNLQSCEVHLDFETGPVLQGESKQSTCWANRACSDGCCKSSFPAGSNNASGSDAERGKYACLRLFNSYGHSDEPVETCFLVLQKRRSGDASVYNRVGIGFSGFGPKQYPGGKVWEDHCPLFEGCKVETVKIE
jgi:hypothetical protein